MTWDDGAGDKWDSGPVATEATNTWDTPGGGGYSGGDARMMGETGNGGGGGGGCFNCGEEGHSKADCTNPRVFTGTCRICEKQGHPAAECPDKPADICRNCKKEGHKVTECKDNRAIDMSSVADLKPDVAWDKLVAADKERELDDFREALKEYTKAVPDSTYDQLEHSFRHLKFNTHVIAYEKEMTDTYTLMDLNGKLDCKYHVGFFFSDKPPRGSLKEGWPSSPEENQKRLKDAGIPVERGIPKCSNCDELGHISKSCPQDKVEREQLGVKCVNCEEVGHRARDCKQALNRVMQPQTVQSLVQLPMLHARFAKRWVTLQRIARLSLLKLAVIAGKRDMCPKMGHFSKECPKPRDYSKVKCTNCDEMGHTKVRCKAPPKDEGGDGGARDYGADTSGGFESSTPAHAASAVTAGGDDDGQQW
ncbi:hypothetical protein MMC18_006174 [Xylographa bjoerkii]|nr:hypothetical protein [Xylographa bjoerkii]